MQCINVENWSYCRYQNGNFMAMVTFGASLDSVQEDALEYYVTVLENEESEIYQKDFDSLTEACFYLNEKYGDWKFEDQTATKSGCLTCAAH